MLAPYGVGCAYVRLGTWSSHLHDKQVPTLLFFLVKRLSYNGKTKLLFNLNT